MAVIISDNRNPAYDGNLSTANGWWRVEAHNLAGFASGFLGLNTTRTINLTFANAGNLKGIIVGLFAGTNKPSNIKDTVTITLKSSGTIVATSSLTREQILGLADFDTFNTNVFTPRFEFDEPVTTAAGVYTVEISQSATGGTGNWNIVTSNGSAPFYLAWCDNQLTASSTNDCLCVQDPIVMDNNFVSKCNGLATGDSTNGVSVILLTHSDGAVATVANLRWLNPASSYSLTIDGMLVFSSHSGIRMGTENSPIPYAQQASIIFKTSPSFGINRGIINLRYSNANCGGGSFFIYGEVPTQRMLRLSADASSGQPDITLTESPSSWQIGDSVYLYKKDNRTLNYTVYTITNVSGNTVTLNSNLPTNYISGGPVINFERYGCVIKSDTTTEILLNTQIPYNFTMQGVYWESVRFNFRGSQQGQNQVAVGPNTSQYLLEDIAHRYTTHSYVLGSFDVPSTNILINRFYGIAQLISSDPSYTPIDNNLGGFKRSGAMSITNCILQGSRTGGFSVRFKGTRCTFSGNAFYNSGGNLTSGQSTVILTDFVEGVFKDNVFWEQNGAVNLNGVFEPSDWGGNIFDATHTCYSGYGSSIGVIIKNDSYGQEIANTYEFNLQPDVYQDIQIENSLGSVKVNETYQNLIVKNTNGSLRVVNDNQVANVDKVWNKNGYIIRTGDGLGDTTRRNGLYALRFESNNNTTSLEWPKNQPTGNIQGKSMTVGVWMYISSTNYWLSGHTMPRITVTYDNALGSTAYGEAAQVAGSWQWVQASFIPTTTFGQIKVAFFTQTEATGPDAYVYFADFSGPLPQGTELNLGEFNLWADAYPLTPLSYSSIINANDVWAANLSAYAVNQTTAGYVVNQIENKATVSQVGQLLADALNN